MTHLHFWKHSEVKRIPKPVLQYIRRRFMLPALYIAGLRCVQHEEMLHGEQVLRMRIFDPYLANTIGFTVNKYQDLEVHPELIQFAGYIDRRGVVYVADRRSPARRRDKSYAEPGFDNNEDNGSRNIAVLPKAKLASYGPGAGQWSVPYDAGEEL